MKKLLPIVGITMGDPVGIGPEIIHKALCNPSIYEICKPLVIGDYNILKDAGRAIDSSLDIHVLNNKDEGRFSYGAIDMISVSDLDVDQIEMGQPDANTGAAMIKYITTAIDLALKKNTAAVVTGPINKVAMKLAGSRFHGHTELLAHTTDTEKFMMMMYGSKLSVVLVTIHIPFADIKKELTSEKIIDTITVTGQSLKERFGLENPRIAVAALNPHAGEDGLFGDEETEIITPAIEKARRLGYDITGPVPPDTVFLHAANGHFDVVVCMYHDQGLIPFKMIHFEDGVNTTLGLPIIRTSVDHGTAYDIAGMGKADPGSLIEAIKLAALQAGNS